MAAEPVSPDVAVSTTAFTVDTTITDDDPAEWSVTGSSPVAEGANATWAIDLSGALGNAETASVLIALTDGGTTAGDLGLPGDTNQDDLYAAISAAAALRAGRRVRAQRTMVCQLQLQSRV